MSLVVPLWTLRVEWRGVGVARQGRREGAMAVPLPRPRTQPGGSQRPPFRVECSERGHLRPVALLELLARPAPAGVVAAHLVAVVDVARLDLRQGRELLTLRIHGRNSGLLRSVVERGRLLGTAAGVAHAGHARPARPA